MTKKDDTPSIGGIEPIRLTGDSRFTFSCHPGVSCFTKCCHGMEIMLAPYDILRLRKRLDISSGEFLEQYTNSSVHEESGLPIVTVKMKEDEDRACPFLSAQGCTIYEDRPSICRYYPVGLASLMTEQQEKTGEDRFYFFIREDHCRGHDESREWTVDEWREDQGVKGDDEINRDWQSAFLSRSLPGQHRSDPSRQAQFYLSCYDLDGFRRFVFESPFLKKFAVDDETVKAIREDDVELLRFALRYMKFIMMIDETMKARGGVVEEWKKEMSPKEEK